ncbi:sulfoxide reductase heme-binding subunit YedZ [Sphaerotilus hippei]|uniref:Protein-methionine-sulfoxide reductase heme-binding subunit MsrQ n=1 Tax=Sphaerotilus hippei TaxID=744406 RepID=A0A318GV22_9BURK|nr:protein-methionine-sulfoxide reductase heme-binding subunit MsrQ [Sphaerotilus hippei]PXW92779.1 sulfoxide reductase heme-binding subunit YedZ [Sphaerotilus hippei]
MTLRMVALDRALRPAWVRRLAWLLCLLPLLLWIVRGVQGELGVNPAETLVRGTGIWTLRMLCVVLAVTPLRQWAGLASIASWRRMLGLFAFFYAVLHLLAYAWLDQGLELPAIARDIAKRPFVLVGFAAAVLMLPLALTSFNRAIRALGARRWKLLHRLVYLIGPLGLLHFFWIRSAKHREGEVLVYAAIMLVLLAARPLYQWHQRRAPARRVMSA